MLNHVRGQVWKRVWILEASSENGCGKWHFLVWNRVWIWRCGRHTPTKNSKDYLPPRVSSTVTWNPRMYCLPRYHLNVVSHRSETNNSSIQNYLHPDNHTIRTREKCSAKKAGKKYTTPPPPHCCIAAPGLVHPASLVGMLPSINCRFQKGRQHCAAEFFQEFCRLWSYRASECQINGFIPKHIDLSFLKIFFFKLRSEVVCLRCNNVTCNSTTETLIPLHLIKVWPVWSVWFK